jgi:DNA-binding transcriptional ArsR family regulator
MSALLGVLAHPHRIRIIQELKGREIDVNGLQEMLGVSHSRVSQHLSIMRSHRIVMERRDGRHVFYRLREEELADWLQEGFRFLQMESDVMAEVNLAVEQSKDLWGKPAANASAKPNGRGDA